MVILYYGYQSRRRRERKFWILVLYKGENRAVGARKFWNLVLHRSGNRAVGARKNMVFRCIARVKIEGIASEKVLTMAPQANSRI